MMSNHNRYICLDTESAQSFSRGHNELIELSVYNTDFEEIYNHRFKPATLRRWDSKIHHITPAMVKDEVKFADCRGEIQQLFDNAESIIGFAINNDIGALSREGIRGLGDKRIFELRELYWYCVGRHSGSKLYSGPGLTKCAEELGVPVIQEEVHSAGGDTKVTLNFFFTLLRRFRDAEMPAADLKADFETIASELLRRTKEEKFRYDARQASGMIHLMIDPGGVYYMKAAPGEIEADNVVASIKVGARRRALYELETLFDSRSLPMHKSMFHLKNSDIERFRNYTCEFDDRESHYRDLTELRRQMSPAPAHTLQP